MGENPGLNEYKSGFESWPDLILYSRFFLTFVLLLILLSSKEIGEKKRSFFSGTAGSQQYCEFSKQLLRKLKLGKRCSLLFQSLMININFLARTVQKFL